VQYVEASGHHSIQAKENRGSETLPITEQAYGLLGEKTILFSPIEATNQRETDIYPNGFRCWNNSKITFHCFRHTFATCNCKWNRYLYRFKKC
jgi:integrase